jgi:hypothetical protein
MYTTRAKIIATLALGTLVTSIIGFTALYVFVHQQKTHFFTQSTERDKTRAQLQALQDLERTLDESKEDRLFLQNRLLEKESIIDFIALIETLAKEQGVVLTTTLAEKPLNKSFSTITMGIRIEGTYAQVMHMLKIHEALPYQSSLGTVSVVRGGEDTWSSTYELRVTQIKSL